tara:strand:+ start:485 stop:1207 length:723 start_codon:yes stop_codon:yes gene_type:complete
MLLKRTNIHAKLLRERQRRLGEVEILKQVAQILQNDTNHEERILETLNLPNNGNTNNFDVDLLESERIFHKDEIKKICINYRLRFLDTKYFKGPFPQETINKIKQVERQHEISLKGFKIIAPSKMFVLRKADDPLLFAPISNDYYYLVDKWGKDLHPLRKWMMWPFKSFENLVFTVLLSSIVATMLVPDGLFTKKQTLSQDIMVFFFIFKSIAAIVIFYGFALGKNFNTAIWQSKFDKTQ